MLNNIYLMNHKKARLCRAFFFCFFLFILTACHSLDSRLKTKDDLLSGTAFHSAVIDTSTFPLFSASKIQSSATDTVPLTIFIEGDGYAWVNRYTASGDPTPTNPVALQMAVNYSGNALYLARPCQYISSPRCTPAYWTYDRFAPDVLQAYMDALDEIATHKDVSSFRIVAFSGGAYIALNLAATRHDIDEVITVAGLLDPQEWTDYHNISPLKPYTPLAKLIIESGDTRFLHICGQEDRVIPCTLTASFIGKTKDAGMDNHIVQQEAGKAHHDLIRSLGALTF